MKRNVIGGSKGVFDGAGKEGHDLQHAKKVVKPLWKFTNFILQYCTWG